MLLQENGCILVELGNFTGAKLSAGYSTLQTLQGPWGGDGGSLGIRGITNVVITFDPHDSSPARTSSLIRASRRAPWIRSSRYYDLCQCSTSHCLACQSVHVNTMT